MEHETRTVNTALDGLVEVGVGGANDARNARRAGLYMISIILCADAIVLAVVIVRINETGLNRRCQRNTRRRALGGTAFSLT